MSIGVGGKWSEIKGRPLSKQTLSFMEEQGFENMSPVQAKSIPMLLANRDVVVEAITGSGKTLAYLVPIIETLLQDNIVEVVKEEKNAVIGFIVLPSRELAQQVHKVCHQYLQFINKTAKVKYSTCCFIGGRDMSVDIEVFQRKGANILIGTPGRLYELLVSSKHTTAFGVKWTEVVVLDEADKLLDFGFKAKLDALLRRFPKQRRTGLFSATQTTELADLARAGMRNPMSISVRVMTGTKSQTNESKPQVPVTLRNFYVCCRASSKIDELLRVLENFKEQKVICYVITCAGAEWLFEAVKKLVPEGTNIFSLHGQMKMGTRQKVHKEFNTATSGTLICTDVAARGLDIPNIGAVVQFDAPVDVNTFIHRIGRTARMGQSGVSVAFLLPQEMEYVNLLKHSNVNLEPMDGDDDNDIEDEEQDVQRTLASVPHDFRNKRKRDGKQKEKKGTVTGDLCESPSVLTLRRAVRETPQLVNQAARAFVSFIRAYKEHECRYIFQLKHLDITDMVHAFALFKVPNCGEIRKMSILKIPLQDEFADILKKLEIERQEKNKKKQEEAEANAKEETELHRSDRNKRREDIKESGMSKNQKSRAWKAAELVDLMKESYLIKKERQGRMSMAQVDRIVGNDALEKAVMSTRERKQQKKINPKK